MIVSWLLVGIVGNWGLGVVSNWGLGVVSNWGLSVVGYWGMSVVGYWGSNSLDNSWSLDNMFDNWSGGYNFVAQRFTMDDGVESVVFIGCVLNCTFESISINQRVFSLDVVSVAAFLLAFNVSGMGIMD